MFPSGSTRSGSRARVQQHKRHQSVSAGLIGRRMLREQCCQADCFVTEFLFHQALTAGRLVTFVEKQVESLQHAVQTA